MLNELRRFNVETGELEEMVALLHLARGVQQEFATLNIPTPPWVDDKVRQLQRAIQSKTADQRDLRIKELQAEQARLKTAAERRAEIQAELDRLQGQTPVGAGEVSGR
jgi:hypothetical protein